MKMELLTQLLCQACELLDNADILSKDEHASLYNWWAKHSENDRVRIAQEHDKALDEYNHQVKKLQAAQAALQNVIHEKQKIEKRKR